MPRLGDLVRRTLERDLTVADNEIIRLIEELAKAQIRRDNIEATLALHNELDVNAVLEATCPECFRVFDLRDETDADEWRHGHDCEVEAS